MVSELKDVSSYEAIKMAQRKELWFLFYYVLYFLDWLRGMWYTWDIDRAKVYVRFEREARDREGTQQYLRYRKKFSWKKYTH